MEIKYLLWMVNFHGKSEFLSVLVFCLHFLQLLYGLCISPVAFPFPPALQSVWVLPWYHFLPSVLNCIDYSVFLSTCSLIFNRDWWYPVLDTIHYFVLIFPNAVVSCWPDCVPKGNYINILTGFLRFEGATEAIISNSMQGVWMPFGLCLNISSGRSSTFWEAIQCNSGQFYVLEISALLQTEVCLLDVS